MADETFRIRYAVPATITHRFTNDWVLCRCGWSLRASGSVGISKWFWATVKRHGGVCPRRNDPPESLYIESSNG